MFTSGGQRSMKTPIIEDRTLARVARDAIGWDDGVTPAAERAEMALGRAVLALRVMGVAATREVTRAVRDDIAILLAPAPCPLRLAA